MINLHFFNISPTLCRLLVQKARKLAQEYMLIYEQNVPPTQLVKRVADVMQEYTQSGYVFDVI
jgi:20S proteasome subunit alpha 2